LNKIFIGCLACKHTGGLTLAHQLCFELRKLGYDARMYYYYGLTQQKTYPVNPLYEKYHLPFDDKLEDAVGNIVVAPETNVEILRGVKKAKRAIWWMSVDNYHLTQHTLKGRIINLFGLRRFRIEQPDIYHFAQSYYAIDFLQKIVDHSHIMYLSDYLDDDFLSTVQKHLNDQKRDRVLYNPSKGIAFTKEIIKATPELEWFPLQGLTPVQMRDVLETSKVYIDFGHHPGKDRIPREAAVSGCCVLTGLRGSARFYQDVPIPEAYKYEDVIGSIPDIVRQIKSCITDYERHYADFEEYRQMIRGEYGVFQQNVKDIFALLCGGNGKA